MHWPIKGKGKGEVKIWSLRGIARGRGEDGARGHQVKGCEYAKG